MASGELRRTLAAQAAHPWGCLRSTAPGWGHHPWHSLRWQSHHAKPEGFDRAYDLCEAAKIFRLRDVAIGVEPIGLKNVLCRLRGGECDHRDAFQPVIGLNLREYLPPLLPG